MCESETVCSSLHQLSVLQIHTHKHTHTQGFNTTLIEIYEISFKQAVGPSVHNFEKAMKHLDVEQYQ